MKNGKKPTLKQKIIIDKANLNHIQWLVIRDTENKLEIISRKTAKTKSKKTRWIEK